MKILLRGKRLEVFVIVGVLLFMGSIASYVIIAGDKSSDNNDVVDETTEVAHIPYASEETDALATEAAKLETEQGDPASAVMKIEEYLASGKGNDKEKAFMNAKAANYYFIYANDKVKAEELYKKAIELQPNDPTWYADLGKMYYLADDKETANKYFQQAIDTYDTKLPEDYNGEAREYFTNLLEGKDPYLQLLKGEQ